MESKDSSIATSEVTCFKRGMLNDPEIRLNYPDTSVVCYQPTQPASVSIEHQSEFCLCENFVNCPVYQRKAVAPPPAETGGGLLSDIRTWVLVPVLLVGLIVGVFFLLSPQNSIANPASPVEQVDAFGTETATATEEIETNGIDTAPTELDTLTPTRDSLFPDLDVSVAAETSTPTPTKLPTATKTLRPTRTPIPTRTPKPSETETPTRRATSSSNSSNNSGVTTFPTATTKWVVKSATSTPNFAATQAVNNTAATATAQARNAQATGQARNAQATTQARNAGATWTAQNAQQTVVAQQTYTALSQIRAQQTAAAVSAQQTTAAAGAAATRSAWNVSLTLTAQAIQTIEAVPPSDRDGDSIPDTEDSCPDQYGIPEYDGCNPFEGGGDGGGDGGGSGGGSDDGRD